MSDCPNLAGPQVLNFTWRPNEGTPKQSPCFSILNNKNSETIHDCRYMTVHWNELSMERPNELSIWELEWGINGASKCPLSELEWAINGASRWAVDMSVGESYQMECPNELSIWALGCWAIGGASKWAFWMNVGVSYWWSVRMRESS